jgi:hypothetical protein
MLTYEDALSAEDEATFLADFRGHGQRSLLEPGPLCQGAGFLDSGPSWTPFGDTGAAGLELGGWPLLGADEGPLRAAARSVDGVVGVQHSGQGGDGLGGSTPRATRWRCLLCRPPPPGAPACTRCVSLCFCDSRGSCQSWTQATLTSETTSELTARLRAGARRRRRRMRLTTTSLWATRVRRTERCRARPQAPLHCFRASPANHP